MSPQSAPLRLGVVGCGRIAQVAHLPAIAKSDSLTLCAVSDPSAALRTGVAGRYEVAAYASTAELLERPDLDAVVVAVPDRLHLSLGRAVLDSGRHLLIEKPVTALSDEAVELEQLAKSTGLIVQVGAMRRHDPGMQWARASLPRIGQPISASIWYRLPTELRVTTEQALFPPMVIDEHVRAGEAQHKADRRSYLLRTHGAHVFDSVRYLFGEAGALRAQLLTVGTDLSWTGEIQCADIPVRFEITANVHADYSEGIDVFGSAGQLRVRSFFPFYRRASEAAVFVEKTAEWSAPQFGAVDPYQRQLEAFAEAVASGGGADPDARDGVEALRLIEATRDSCAAGGAVVCL